MKKPSIHCRSWLLVLLAPLAAMSCTLPKEIMGEPAKDDPMDGYQPYLSEGGQNTQMDFGPGQNNLMSVCAELRTKVSKLERTLEERELEISKLQANLSTEKSKFDSESRERAQIDATNGQLQRSIRELESQVLTLSVQKAELDVELTKLRIAQLQAQLDSASPATEAAAGTPAAPLGRGRLE